MTESVIKPAASAATAYAIEKFYFKNNEDRTCLIFAATVGASTFLSSSLQQGGMVPVILPDMGSLASGKGLTYRIQEIVLGSGIGYLASNYVLNARWSGDTAMKRIAAVAVCNIVGESVSDFMTTGEVNYFDAV